MALQGMDGGVLAFSGSGLEQAIEKLKQIYPLSGPALPENEEISQLVYKMEYIIAVLKDAKKKQISSEIHRFWLGKLKEVAFDAEDLIDELATDAAVQSMGAHIYNIPTRMMDQICKMNGRLDRLEHQIDVLAFQLPNMKDSCPVLPTWRQTGALLPDKSSVIGRNGEKEQIIEILLSDPVAESSSNNNKGFSIVPIVGWGGMGKTTLAQLVYNDKKVQKHFELMMWVCVSNNSDRQRLTKEMIEAAFAYRGKYEKCEVTKWDTLQQTLLKEVEGKTFLLVLDDVWGAEHSTWEELLKPLHSGKKGSKVLVTSRNRAFVDKREGRMETPIHLRGLSDANIWDVFKKYAFKGNMGHDGTISAKDLENLEGGIVQKLKGSPLAAKTLGSLLNCNLSIQHWKTVLESELWGLKLGENDILPVLQLSYQYLSADLKQCFAYCSLFPKDYEFSREEVVQLWEAQSFIRRDRGMRMGMESKYFEELLHMSFFEPPPGQSDGNDDYVMHDLIHDLAVYVSRDDCFRLEDQKFGETPETTGRHVSIWFARRDQIKITINELCRYEKLRTLLFMPLYVLDLNTSDLNQLFLKLKMLRVLRLSDCGIRELPGSIGDLKHLRYLDLEGNHDLEELPESLGNLHNLQVLILNYCDSLEMLPPTMSKLVNLKHLQPYERGLLSTIDGVGKLTGLQELQVSGSQLGELGGMCMLRELKITDLEDVGSKDEAIQARLHTMERLQVLHLYWWMAYKIWVDLEDREPELEEKVLQALRPNAGIRELHINGYRGIMSPDWMEDSTLLNSFSSLKRVSLKDCPNWQVPPCSFLGQLRHLEYLEINQMPEWEEWSSRVSWGYLQQLTIGNCPKLRRLDLFQVGISCLHSELDGCSRVDGGIETTSSPYSSPPTSASLSRLYISFCDNLTSISELLQQQLPNLERIEITFCKNLMSLPEKGFGHLVSLKRLRIANCPELTCPLQEGEKDALSQHLPCSLEELQISQCGDAMGGWWWIGLQHLTSIAHLSLCGCPTTIERLFDRLKRNPQPHLSATLRGLVIEGYNRSKHGQQSATSSACSSQLSPPPNNVDASAGILTSLKELTIRRSPNFLQKWRGCVSPSSLERLTIDDDDLSHEDLSSDDDLSNEDLSNWWHNLISLKQLTLEHLKNLHSLPDLGGLASLETLDISSCPSINTLEVMSLPTSLKSLDLMYLKNLHSLPDLSCLPSLETLKISQCPLTERYKDKPKSMWLEVAHIPHVEIDWRPLL